MTYLELNKARMEYKANLIARMKLLECFENEFVSYFLENYFPRLNKNIIFSLAEEEMIRYAFLSTIQDTKNSNHLLVYLNDIIRKGNTITDAQPILESYDSTEDKNFSQNGLNVFKLFCDLETNKPMLISDYVYNFSYFKLRNHTILLPEHIPGKESYHYNSNSLEKITKGTATDKFNRLQLYFYKELLTKSQEDVVKKVLQKDTIEKVCLGK